MRDVYKRQSSYSEKIAVPGKFLREYKQKTAYEILRSDWSSDVCSSDLIAQNGLPATQLIAHITNRTT